MREPRKTITARNTLIYTGLAIILSLSGLSACGTNTDEPVFPLFVFNTVGAPTIVSATTSEIIDEKWDPENRRMVFDLTYYVTNSEDGFQGYNLYIRKSSSSAEATLGGVSGDPYLPNGIRPSFPHVGVLPDTSASGLQTQRITHFTPPPGERAFEYCELYYFRLTAQTRAGTESNASPELSTCAATDTSECPSDSPCL